MLVFSQFREMTAPLASFLGGVFGRPGLVLHGGTAVAQRRKLVDQFQTDETVPFFVLSLKAGGTGLNLTAASHVIHFDRWWNPAVENQATDRAFRIGQKKAVLVHKFICRGTVEDRIDALIESKRSLSRDLLEGGAEIPLTELPDDELLASGGARHQPGGGRMSKRRVYVRSLAAVAGNPLGRRAKGAGGTARRGAREEGRPDPVAGRHRRRERSRRPSGATRGARISRVTATSPTACHEVEATCGTGRSSISRLHRAR